MCLLTPAALAPEGHQTFRPVLSSFTNSCLLFKQLLAQFSSAPLFQIFYNISNMSNAFFSSCEFLICNCFYELR